MIRRGGRGPTESRSGSLRPGAGALVLVAALLAGALLGGALLGGCGAPPSAPTPPASPSRAAPSGTPVTLYYVGDTPAGPRLFRESHSNVNPAMDRASNAVDDLFASPAGIDPDYRSQWPAGWSLHAPVRHADGVITVDLHQPTGAREPASIELARLGVQQLVYTVQDALASTDPVRILLDGEPVDRFWGQLSLADPVARADPLTVRSLVQIDSPGQAAVFIDPSVRVSGDAATAEGDVQWQVLRGTTVVAHGHATTGQSLVFSPYSFTVQLQPGQYTLRVAESDAADGEGRPAMADTKTITVRR